jgi:hypothetical protein
VPVRPWKPVLMVTPGHMACGAITAMRSLSDALLYRYCQEEAACHLPGRGGSRGRHRRCRPCHPGRGHAVPHHAPADRHDPAGPGCRCRGHRARPDRACALRGYPAFGQEASAESELGVLTGRPARRAQGCPRARACGEPGARRQSGNSRETQDHDSPAEPCGRCPEPGCRGPGSLCSAQPAPGTSGADGGHQPRRRMEQRCPPQWAAAGRLPARIEPGWPRPGPASSGCRPAHAPSAAARSHVPA